MRTYGDIAGPVTATAMVQMLKNAEDRLKLEVFSRPVFVRLPWWKRWLIQRGWMTPPPLGEGPRLRPQARVVFRRPPVFTNPARRTTMAITTIRIEAIENGFLVATSDNVPSGSCDLPRPRFYPTLADLAVDIPDIMEKAVNEAEDREQRQQAAIEEKVKHYRECPDADVTKDEAFVRTEPAMSARAFAEPLDLSEDDRA